MRPETSAPYAPSPLVPVLFGILNALHCGAILLDENKRIAHLNDRAQPHLGEVLSTNRGRLCATDRGCDALFQTILDQALRCGERERAGRRQTLGLKRDDKRPVIARVVSTGGEAADVLDGAALVVLLVDPEDGPKVSYALLQQVFGLTRGEARLANQLLCGPSLQEIAETDGLSVATVRSHTKAVLAKTRTHRQAQLVGLLARLAMISETDAEWL
jgi:DNA-binding CsgD family transcriptional regulator